VIRTLIIEDEVPAASRLQRLLEEIDPAISVLDRLESVSSAISWLEENPAPDLLMLDIQLADGLSFDIFRKIKIESFVIFTTAYDEYAIKAFDLNSIDYLLKPVNKEKLSKALAKYRKLKSERSVVDIESLLIAMERGRKRYKERFAITIGTKIKSIESKKIGYIYTLDKNTFLCTREDRHYPMDHSLERLEELLDPKLFFRINRQYVVNYFSIDKVSVLSKSRVAIHLQPPTKDPVLVSTARTHSFRQWLDR